MDRFIFKNEQVTLFTVVTVRHKTGVGLPETIFHVSLNILRFPVSMQVIHLFRFYSDAARDIETDQEDFYQVLK